MVAFLAVLAGLAKTVETDHTASIVVATAALASVFDWIIRNRVSAGEFEAISSPRDRKVRKGTATGTGRVKVYTPSDLANIVIVADAKPEQEQGVAPEAGVSLGLAPQEPPA